MNDYARLRAQGREYVSTLETMYAEKAKSDSDWAMFTFQRDYMVKLGAERRRQRHEIDLETQKQEAAMARTEAQETGATERTQMGETAATGRAEMQQAGLGTRQEKEQTFRTTERVATQVFKVGQDATATANSIEQLVLTDKLSRESAIVLLGVRRDFGAEEQNVDILNKLAAELRSVDVLAPVKDEIGVVNVPATIARNAALRTAWTDSTITLLSPGGGAPRTTTLGIEKQTQALRAEYDKESTTPEDKARLRTALEDAGVELPEEPAVDTGVGLEAPAVPSIEEPAPAATIETATQLDEDGEEPVIKEQQVITDADAFVKELEDTLADREQTAKDKRAKEYTSMVASGKHADARRELRNREAAFDNVWGGGDIAEKNKQLVTGWARIGGHVKWLKRLDVRLEKLAKVERMTDEELERIQSLRARVQSALKELILRRDK